MSLEKRLRALEDKLCADPVVLFFEDGSTRELRGRGDFLLGLFGSVFGREISRSQAAQLDLIRRCFGAREPDGAHLVELIKSVMPEPGQEREDT